MTAAFAEHNLSNQTRAAQVLKAALLEMTDDPDCLADMIEGETSLHEAIGKVMDGITEDEIMVAGIRDMLEQMLNRRLRIEARIDRRRNAIKRAMIVGELTKLELPQATLSVRAVPPKLEIVSEEMLPQKYFAQVPKLLRAELWADVKAGEIIPGARLSNGSTTLSIRRT